MTSQETNTPLHKSTMTTNQNNQLEGPNPYGVGELGFLNNLSKPEINKNGPVLLKEEKHFCKNGCSGASPDAVHFALKCLTDIIRFQKILKLNKTQRKKLKQLLQPYQKQVLKLATPSKHKSILKQVYNQKGGGIFTSLIAAVVPLITSLVSRLLRRGKK